jgi:hypothetical protein
MASNLARRRDTHIDEWRRDSKPLQPDQWQVSVPTGSTCTATYYGYSGEPRTHVYVASGFTRAPRFAALQSAIDDSKALTNLPADWDEAGAKPIAKATWESAVEALRAAARTSFRRFNYALPVPSIGPCADGSVDLYWNTQKFTLLINVQPNDSAKASDFYGEREGAKVQGVFDPAAPKFDFLTLLVQP